MLESSETGARLEIVSPVFFCSDLTPIMGRQGRFERPVWSGEHPLLRADFLPSSDLWEGSL